VWTTPRLTYAALVLQFHVTSLVLFFGRKQTFATLTWVGVSTAINGATGLALSIAVGCSQPCVLRSCRCLQSPSGLGLQEDMPPNNWRVEMQLGSSERLYRGNVTFTAFMMPPRPLGEVECLVFVYTDIESSSALWGIHDGHVMKEATEIHDTLMRSVLDKVGGYEIATAGDAFHLVFSTIQRAVLFCLTVQLRLMMSKWPKDLDRMAPATRTVRSGMRVIFRGLRVRMGVHYFDEADGPMVRTLHTATGTATYTGASAVIASTVSDLAAGGQILVTTPIASWVREHRYDVPIACVLESTPVGGLCLAHSVCTCLGANWELFQLYPMHLTKRQGAVATATANAYQGDTSGHACCENSDEGLHSRLSEEDLRRCTSHLDSGSGLNGVGLDSQRMASA
jgi:class 3 adenylate cyclase